MLYNLDISKIFRWWLQYWSWSKENWKKHVRQISHPQKLPSLMTKVLRFPKQLPAGAVGCPIAPWRVCPKSWCPQRQAQDFQHPHLVSAFRDEIPVSLLCLWNSEVHSKQQTVKFLWVNGPKTQIQFQKQPDDHKSIGLFLHPPNLSYCWATCGWQPWPNTELRQLFWPLSLLNLQNSLREGDQQGRDFCSDVAEPPSTHSDSQQQQKGCPHFLRFSSDVDIVVVNFLTHFL